MDQSCPQTRGFFVWKKWLTRKKNPSLKNHFSTTTFLHFSRKVIADEMADCPLKLKNWWQPHFFLNSCFIFCFFIMLFYSFRPKWDLRKVLSYLEPEIQRSCIIKGVILLFLPWTFHNTGIPWFTLLMWGLKKKTAEAKTARLLSSTKGEEKRLR